LNKYLSKEKETLLDKKKKKKKKKKKLENENYDFFLIF